MHDTSSAVGPCLGAPGGSNALICCAKSSFIFSSRSTKPRKALCFNHFSRSQLRLWPRLPLLEYISHSSPPPSTQLLPARPLSHAAPGLHSHNQKQGCSISSSFSTGEPPPQPDTLNGCRAGHLHARQACYLFGRGQKVN